MTESEQSLRRMEQRAVEHALSLLVLRINALPVFGTLVRKSDVIEILETVGGAGDNRFRDPSPVPPIASLERVEG